MITVFDKIEPNSMLKYLMPNYKRVVRTKYYLHDEQSPSRNKEGYLPVWKKQFFEHTIKDEENLQNILEYKYLNPQNMDWLEMQKIGNINYVKFGFWEKSNILLGIFCDYYI